MTSVGDLCKCAECKCGDLASPGHDLCTGCIADRQAEREITAAAAARATALHEAEVAAQEDRTS